MPRRRRFGAPVLLLPVLATLLSGCFTGKRPHVDEAQPVNTATSGDSNIDAVLQRLDQVAASTFTAHLNLLTRRGGVETPVVVSQDGPRRSSVTIGDVRYLRSGDASSTCTLTTGVCSPGIDESRVSDVQFTSEFFRLGAAARLRQDARTKIGASASSSAVLADQPATCVQVPVSGYTKAYCVLDNGVLASMDSTDIAITLASYADTVDESLFATA